MTKPRVGRPPKCWCDSCTAKREKIRGRVRKYRKGRLDSRIVVDGRLVAPVPPEKHGRASTYTNWGCRCQPCTEAQTSTFEATRRERFKRRQLVNGRLVATGNVQHGLATTYVNWGCRCPDCCRGMSNYHYQQRRRVA